MLGKKQATEASFCGESEQKEKEGATHNRSPIRTHVILLFSILPGKGPQVELICSNFMVVVGAVVVVVMVFLSTVSRAKTDKRNIKAFKLKRPQSL